MWRLLGSLEGHVTLVSTVRRNEESAKAWLAIAPSLTAYNADVPRQSAATGACYTRQQASGNRFRRTAVRRHSLQLLTNSGSVTHSVGQSAISYRVNRTGPRSKIQSRINCKHTKIRQYNFTILYDMQCAKLHSNKTAGLKTKTKISRFIPFCYNAITIWGLLKVCIVRCRNYGTRMHTHQSSSIETSS